MPAATTAEPAAPSFDERWPAWQARGADHDRRSSQGRDGRDCLAVAAAIFQALLLR